MFRAESALPYFLYLFNLFEIKQIILAVEISG
jgi:hypothetical protein